jgi:type VI secretion system protein ImpA
LLVTEGLTGFAKVTTYIRGCLEQYWATCHPELDEDDDNDPTMRINTVQGLCGQPGGQSGPSRIYRALRRAPLAESRGFGRFSIRDIEIAQGHVPPPENMTNVPDSASISAAFRDSNPDALADRVRAAKTVLEDLKAISAVFDSETPGTGPELDPVIKLAFQIVKTLDSYAGSETSSADMADDGEASGDVAESGGDSVMAAPAGAVAVGGLRSPADVASALDRIIEYYQRNEPSSPLPIILKRARRLVNADFMTIMKDLAPGGVDNVRMISGSDGD